MYEIGLKVISIDDGIRGIIESIEPTEPHYGVRLDGGNFYRFHGEEIYPDRAKSSRKYTNIRVLHNVYCSSTCHYGFTVILHDAKRGYRLDYCPSSGLTYFDKKGRPCSKEFPKYVIDEVEATILRYYDANELAIYEVDRDGNRRRTNYRYHSPELLAQNIEWLRKSG